MKTFFIRKCIIGTLTKGVYNMKKEASKVLSAGKDILYAADQTPPKSIWFFSSLQHMLLVLSLGMSMPVAIARTVGLDFTLSSSLLAAAMFSMGMTTIFQTIKTKYIGSGYQSVSVSDSAALAACIVAAEIGGVPLVLGMTVFSGILKFILGSFTFRLRNIFPPEVTGTMIFIVGINTVPTGMKYFFGTANEVFNPLHPAVALATLLFMLACTIFIQRLKPYTALLGIVFGFILSALTGQFDVASLSVLKEQAIVSLPVYKELAFSFDFSVVIPFVIVTLAAVVDEIGDYSACQMANDPERQKPDWRSIENGIRGSSVGSILSGFMGGAMQSTATTNIGIARATGITSRKVAYLAGIMLMVVSCFPGLTGILSMIPEPVLGAVLMYSICYIMAGGFKTLASRVLDDRQIFVVFLSICFAVSTLIPGVYDFLPAQVAQYLVSPMVMGVCVLLISTLLAKIGTKRKFSFITGVDSKSIPVFNEEIEDICRQWGMERKFFQRLQIGLDAVCEGVEELNPNGKLHFDVMYNQMQVKLHIETHDTELEESSVSEDSFTSLSISIMMLRNMFESVKMNFKDGKLIIDVSVDV